MRDFCDFLSDFPAIAIGVITVAFGIFIAILVDTFIHHPWDILGAFGLLGGTWALGWLIRLGARRLAR